MKPTSPDFPLMVVCPECKASIGAKCTQPRPGIGGLTFVEWYHEARIHGANDLRKKVMPEPKAVTPEPLATALDVCAVVVSRSSRNVYTQSVVKQLDSFDLWGYQL